MRYCSGCGALNDTDAKFCTECGKSLTLNETEEIVPETDIAEAASAEAEPELVPVAEAEPVFVPAVEAEPEFTSAPAPIPVPDPISTDEETTENNITTPEENTPVMEDHPVKGRVFGIIAFVLNIEALILSLIPVYNWVALIEAIVGLIFCRVSRKNTEFKLTKPAKILGVLALIFSIVTIILYTVLFVLLIVYIADSSYPQDFLDGLTSMYR